MLQAVSVSGSQVRNPRLILKRVLTAIATLVVVSIEKRGEYMLEVERALGPYGIIDLFE